MSGDVMEQLEAVRAELAAIRERLDAADTCRMLAEPEVCRRLAIGRSTLYRLIASGEFPRGRKVGGGTRWPARVVERWIDGEGR